MKHPLASIIVPAFNAEGYIKEALDSALNQTYTHTEVIVVDDGSTDNTRAITELYMKKDHRIRYVYQENRGLSGARNAGLREAQGEYVALLDADDFFLPRKIEESVAFLESHPEVHASYHDVYHFWDGKPEELLKLNYNYYSGKDVLRQLIQGYYFIAPSTVMFRRSTFEQFGYFDEKLRRSEDLEFFVRITAQGAMIHFIPQMLGKIRLKDNAGLQSFSSQANMKVASLQAFERLYQEMTREMRIVYRFNFYLGYHRLRAGMACLAIGEKERAREYILRSFNTYRWGWIVGRLLWGVIFLVPVRLWQVVIPWYRDTRLRQSLIPIKRMTGKLSSAIVDPSHFSPAMNTIENLPKIHLGCGETYLEGYVNVDFPPEEHTVASVHPDQYADVRTLDYPPGSVSEVRAHHLFEHFTRPESIALLLRWRRWLVPGGRLVLETPDAEGIARAFLKSKSLADQLALERHLFGSQEAGWAIHYDGWFAEKYRVVMKELGFQIEKLLPFQNNVTKRLGYQASGILDTMIRVIPGPVRKMVGLNDLPNILCIAIKKDTSIDEQEAAKNILSLSLVGKETKILSVWLKEFENLLRNDSK